MKYEDINIGDQVCREFFISDKDVKKFIKLTKDTNPVHETIVHGMLSASYIATMIGTGLPGYGALITSHNIRFIRPVRENTGITVTLTVNEKANGSIKIYADVTNDDGDIVISSTAWVKILEHEKGYNI